MYYYFFLKVAVVFASNERLCAHLVCTAECRPAGSARLPHETVLGVIEAVALARARALLPPAWLPTHVAIESQPLPCTPSGKLDRKLLASRSDKAIAGASGACNGEVVKDDPVVAGPPTTPFQTLYHTIRRLWEELLAVRHIQPDDNFMQLGADSLNAMRACTRLKATLQPPTSEDAEVGRRTGYLGGVFSVEALASSPSLKAYAATVANAMSVPLTDAEAAFVEAELPATAAATAAGHVVPTAREALLLAAEHNWVAAAQTLLEAPPGGGCTRLADVNGGWTRSSPIFTPLHAAARGGGVETLKVRVSEFKVRLLFLLAFLLDRFF